MTDISTRKRWPIKIHLITDFLKYIYVPTYIYLHAYNIATHTLTYFFRPHADWCLLASKECERQPQL